MSIKNIACKIREFYDQMTKEFIIDLINWLDEQKAVNGFTFNCNIFNNDMLVSSMARFPIYDCDFGYGRPVNMLVPTFYLPGIMWIFPNSQNNGLRIEFCLEKDEMESFLTDEYVNKLFSIV